MENTALDIPTPSSATSPGPPASASPPAPAAAAPAGGVQVFQPPAHADAVEAPPDSFFDYSLADMQRQHASVLARSRALNDAPLLTAKHRDAAAAEREKRKADKWPTTTIRVKFSDGTQIQRVFPSSSPIQPVYAFVRDSLAASAHDKAFTLYQPPRAEFPEHPAPAPKPAKPHPNPAMRARVAGAQPVRKEGGSGGAESLAELGLVPQSVLLVKWADAEMNASTAPAPLTDELRAAAAPLPSPQVKETPETGKKLTGSMGEVKMPKWLQKGLMKKK